MTDEYYLMKEVGARPFIVKNLEPGSGTVSSPSFIAIHTETDEKLLVFFRNIVRRVSEREVLLRSIK